MQGSLYPFGTVVGDYELVEPINRGGMSIIYKARSRSTGEMAAVSLLPPEAPRDARSIRAFTHGAHLAEGFDHPNIVRVLAISEDVEKPYIVLEYIPGRNLKALIVENDAYTERHPLGLFRAIAEGLQYFHNRRIIHRDIKPENILVGDDRQTKIADFSLAVERQGKFFQAKTIVGSPSYVAPEQIITRRYDERIDIYSLGVTMYEVLTRRVPYTGATEQEVLQQHVDARVRPPPIRDLNSSVPARVEAIVMRCLEKDPERRYPDIGLVLRDIKALIPAP